MYLAKVKRGQYQSLINDKLEGFGTRITEKCVGKIYEFVQPQVKFLTDQVLLLRTALTEAATGGKPKVYAKNAQQVVVVKALNNLMDALERAPNMSVQFLLDLGLELRLERTTSHKGVELSKPNIVTAKSTGEKGELRVVLEMEKGGGLLNVAFEHSVDKGETWVNGTYSSAATFTWSKLPSAQDLMIRCRALGTNQRKSEWSEVVTASVL
jgi:hypothetical protein